MRTRAKRTEVHPMKLLSVLFVVLVMPTIVSADLFVDDFSTNTSDNYEQRGANFEQGYVRVDPPDSFDGFIIPKYANGSLMEYRTGENFTVLLEGVKGGTEFYGISIKASRGAYDAGDPRALYGYSCVVRSSTGLLTFLNAAVAWSSAGPPIADNTAYWFKAQWDGTNMNCKAWLNGTAEPTGWNLTIPYTADTANTSEQVIGVVAEGSAALLTKVYEIQYTGASYDYVDGLYSYWSLDADETIGTEAVDAYGNDNLTIGANVVKNVTALLNEGTENNVTGVSGTTYILRDVDGVNGYNPGTGGRAFSTWVYPKNLAGSNLQWLFGGGAGGAWFLSYNAATHQWNLGMGSDNNGFEYQIYNNTWYNIIATYDDVQDRSQIYINGVLAANVSHSQTINFQGTSINIGADDGGNSPFVGIFDSLALYNKTLTQYDVTKVYNYGLPIDPRNPSILESFPPPEPKTTVKFQVQDNTGCSQPGSPHASCPGNEVSIPGVKYESFCVYETNNTAVQWCTTNGTAYATNISYGRRDFTINQSGLYTMEMVSVPIGDENFQLGDEEYFGYIIEETGPFVNSNTLNGNRLGMGAYHELQFPYQFAVTNFSLGIGGSTNLGLNNATTNVKSGYLYPKFVGGGGDSRDLGYIDEAGNDKSFVSRLGPNIGTYRVTYWNETYWTAELEEFGQVLTGNGTAGTGPKQLWRSSFDGSNANVGNMQILTSNSTYVKFTTKELMNVTNVNVTPLLEQTFVYEDGDEAGAYVNPTTFGWTFVANGGTLTYENVGGSAYSGSKVLQVSNGGASCCPQGMVYYNVPSVLYPMTVKGYFYDNSGKASTSENWGGMSTASSNILAGMFYVAGSTYGWREPAGTGTNLIDTTVTRAESTWHEYEITYFSPTSYSAKLDGVSFGSGTMNMDASNTDMRIKASTINHASFGAQEQWFDNIEFIGSTEGTTGYPAWNRTSTNIKVAWTDNGVNTNALVEAGTFSSVTENIGASLTTTESASTKRVGQRIDVKVNGLTLNTVVKPSAGDANTAYISYTNGTVISTAPISGGVATLNTALPIGTYFVLFDKGGSTWTTARTPSSIAYPVSGQFIDWTGSVENTNVFAGLVLGLGEITVSVEEVVSSVSGVNVSELLVPVNGLNVGINDIRVTLNETFENSESNDEESGEVNISKLSSPSIVLPSGTTVNTVLFNSSWSASTNGIGTIGYDVVFEIVGANSTITTNTPDTTVEINNSVEGTGRMYVRASDDWFTTEYVPSDSQFTVNFLQVPTDIICAALTAPNEDDLPSAVIIPVNFSVEYGLGNFTGVGINVTLSLDNVLNVSVDATACTESGTGNNRTYNCSVPMRYFYSAGQYDLRINYTVNGNMQYVQVTDECEYAQLLASQRTINVISFPQAGPGVNNAVGEPPVTVRNTGNVQFNVSVESYDLRGRTDNAVLSATNFQAGEEFGSAVTLGHNTTTALGESVTPADGAKLNVSFWLSMPADAKAQEYFTPIAWQMVTSG